MLYSVLFVSELVLICLDAFTDYIYRNVAPAELLDYRLLALEHFVYAEKCIISSSMCLGRLLTSLYAL